MNEIFGEDNFIGQIIIQSNPRGSQSIKHLAMVHEYVLIYTRDFNKFEMRGLELKESMRAEYKYTYKDGRKYRLLGLRQRGGAWRKEDRPLLYFPIYINQNNGQISLSKTENYKVKILPIKPTTNENGTWRWNREKIENNKNLLIGKQIDRRAKDKAWDIYQMDFLKISEEEERRTKAKTIWIDKELNYQNARIEVKEIFEGRDAFGFPKPKFLILQLLKMVDFEDDDVILDSFSGSGTTGHAVLDLNQNNNLNCNFILVECEDYADRITAERVRRVIKGVRKAKDEDLKQGLSGSFSYFELGKPIELESILSGDRLPSYEELARYIFYTATGEEFDEKALNEKKNFVGVSRNYEVYLFYEPHIEKLKNIALTLDRARALGKPGEKRRLVFAPTKYLDQSHLDELRIDFAQLPFEIYELAR
jgi:adenine-specific DNA-methyltransferase